MYRKTANDYTVKLSSLKFVELWVQHTLFR